MISVTPDTERDCRAEEIRKRNITSRSVHSDTSVEKSRTNLSIESNPGVDDIGLRVRVVEVPLGLAKQALSYWPAIANQAAAGEKVIASAFLTPDGEEAWRAVWLFLRVDRVAV
jgi:hypothetical protein